MRDADDEDWQDRKDIERYLIILPEFLHVFKVLEFGRKKYGGKGDSWLEPNSKKMDHKSTHDSMFHHLAEGFIDGDCHDPESGLDVHLHLACRALMFYTRGMRGIKHDDD